MGDIFHLFSFTVNEILDNLNFHIIYISKEPTKWPHRLIHAWKEGDLMRFISIATRALISTISRKLFKGKFVDNGKIILIAQK